MRAALQEWNCYCQFCRYRFSPDVRDEAFQPCATVVVAMGSEKFSRNPSCVLGRGYFALWNGRHFPLKEYRKSAPGWAQVIEIPILAGVVVFLQLSPFLGPWRYLVLRNKQ